MKKILYILSFFLLSATGVFAQDDEGGGGKIPERMNEYLQKRLNLNKSEADRFSPVFLNYFNDVRKTKREFKGDGLILQQKIVDLRLRYRNQFKEIMGDKRSNDLFIYEREFINEVKDIRDKRKQQD